MLFYLLVKIRKSQRQSMDVEINIGEYSRILIWQSAVIRGVRWHVFARREFSLRLAGEKDS